MSYLLPSSSSFSFHCSVGGGRISAMVCSWGIRFWTPLPNWDNCVTKIGQVSTIIGQVIQLQESPAWHLHTKHVGGRVDVAFPVSPKYCRKYRGIVSLLQLPLRPLQDDCDNRHCQENEKISQTVALTLTHVLHYNLPDASRVKTAEGKTASEQRIVQVVESTCSESGADLLTPLAARAMGLPSQGASATGTELYSSCKTSAPNQQSIHCFIKAKQQCCRASMNHTGGG